MLKVSLNRLYDDFDISLGSFQKVSPYIYSIAQVDTHSGYQPPDPQNPMDYSPYDIGLIKVN